MEKKRPILAISMGDPAGIGPEIIVKALSKPEIYDECRPVVAADYGVMQDALRITNSKLTLNKVDRPAEARFQYGCIDVIDMHDVDMSKLEYGKVSAMAGNAAFESVVKVIELAMNGEADATITPPLNKEAMNLAGHHFNGHTEIYATYTNTTEYSMMMAHDNLRVVHVSTHVSLAEACRLVKKERVLSVIKLADKTCRELGIEHPRVAVAGLNPHAGENGMFGREEIEEITPAIEEAQKLGFDATGPYPPDSVFSKARGGGFDIVVAMYHDQGHIPLKVVGFIWDQEKKKWNDVAGVNITLGLPIIRSSVDHGTAFGKAGKGTASELSLINAIHYGVVLANNRQPNEGGN